MLDSVITAVDDGFSYDGIVSIPETGLEDVGHRPGLAGWLDGSVVRPPLLLPTTITDGVMRFRSYFARQEQPFRIGELFLAEILV